MITNKITGKQIADLLECIEVCEKMSVSNSRMASALRELLEYRKAEAAPVAYLCRQVLELRERFGTSGEWEVNARLVESDLPTVEIPESENYEFVPLYTAPQPLTNAERAELQEYREADVTLNNEENKQPSSKKTIGVNDFIDAIEQSSSKYPR